MIFQTLDDKSECIGIYADGKLIFSPDEFPPSLSRTWNCSSYLRELDVEYASLYLEGKPLKEVLPEYLQDDWEDVSRQIAAFRRSLKISQVNMSENCFYDLVPDRFLVEMCEIKNKITDYVFTTYPRPSRYKFNHHLALLLEDISNQKVNIDHRVLNSLTKVPKLIGNIDRIQKSAPRVSYNQFGSRTGRLTTKPSTFPILTLPQSLRRAIVPVNDLYLELDFNGAEIRTLLGMLGHQQPTEDVHQFHLETIFQNLSHRGDAKTAFFAWLYGSKTAVSLTQAEKLSAFYQKDTLLQKYWLDGNILTPYGKAIPDVSRHHALNYLVQSTAAELLLKQALKISELLRSHNSRSHIAFLVHDSIVLDLKEKDLELIESISYLFGSTNFGTFKINAKKGKNLGELYDF